MKNVLFTSDAFLYGGFESRLDEQLYFYNQKHIKSFLVCDSYQESSLAQRFFKTYPNVKFLPQNGQLLAKDIIDLSKKIIAICRENHIDFIECQPFWCLIPATIAAQKCNVPISYTLHGTISGNFIDTTTYYEASLLFYECLLFGIDQLVAVSERLSNIYHYLSKDIFISPNNINIHPYRKKDFQKTGHFAIASRLDGPKTKIIIDFLPKLIKFKDTKQIDIYGDGEEKTKLQAYIKKHNFSNKIKILGWVSDLPAQLHDKNYDCVFGIGRITTDTISANLPAGILGYGGFAGILNKKNLEDFAKTNFLSWETFPDNFLYQELSSLYQNPSAHFFNKRDLLNFDANKNWQAHIQKMQNVIHQNKPPIKAIADALVKNPNENLYFGTALLKTLYSNLALYGQDSLLYSPYLTHLANLYESLQKELSHTKNQLSQITNSLSWKTTAPLRKLKYRAINTHKKPRA